MIATIIEGKTVARLARERITRQVTELPQAPGLATVLVGDDPASAVYVNSSASSVFRPEWGPSPASARRHQPARARDDLAELNADPGVTGILLQLPRPGHLDSSSLIARIGPDKDVDGARPACAHAPHSGSDRVARRPPRSDRWCARGRCWQHQTCRACAFTVGVPGGSTVLRFTVGVSPRRKGWNWSVISTCPTNASAIGGSSPGSAIRYQSF